MIKNICVLTATRAEYGLLKPVITKLNNNNKYNLKIVATGAHLSPEFGYTYKEIEKDGFIIDEKIEILLSSDSEASISKAMGLAMISFSSYFEREKPDLLVVLGDRYETLAVCMTAMNQKIPIAHLYGGETTEGAIDESIRHAITKLSYIHFTSTAEYRQRVIQLGEEPSRVFNVGGLGVENILNEPLLTKNELAKSLGVDLNKKYAVATFHPVTLENATAEEQAKSLLNVCKNTPNFNFIFTKANADADGRVINKLIDEYSEKYENIYGFTSLGLKGYLSALKYTSFVLGNSSSGLLEAPSFAIPTINIGDRQKGRLQASSVINCIAEENEIANAIKIAMSDNFINIAKKTINPYGDGKTSEKVINILDDFLFNNKINLKKTFYDIKE